MNIAAVSVDHIRKRHTNVEGGLLDIMMLIAITCQFKKYTLKTIVVEYLRISMPPGSSIADNRECMGYLSHLFTKPLRLFPWAATLAFIRLSRAYKRFRYRLLTRKTSQAFSPYIFMRFRSISYNKNQVGSFGRRELSEK